MYQAYDTYSAITEVQEYLSVVTDEKIPIQKVGVYDENTRLAVMDFQRRSNIPQSGIVDKTTFDALYAEYEKEMLKSEVNKMSDSTFPIQEGSSGEEVRSLNIKMKEILEYHGLTHNIRPSSYFSDESTKAAIELRGIFSLDEKEHIDEGLYYRIENEHKSLKIFSEENIN